MFWWGAFTIARIADRAAANSINDDSLEAGRNGTIALIISDGLDAAGAILAIVVVRLATDRLDGRAAEKVMPPEPEGPSSWEAPERPPAGAPA